MSAGPDPTARGDARALVRRLVALEEGPLRAGAAARALAELAPERAALALGLLARDPAGEARAAIAAVGQALAEDRAELGYERRVALYEAAAALGLVEVTGLLLRPPSRRAYVEPRDKADPRLARLTLGHKKALARAQRDPDLLARLAAEGDPVVVRELLRNPQLTEPFAVRIASRRPVRPETLRCVYESRRWRTRPAIALALVRNPYVETEIALKLVPFLGARELADVARDGVVHPAVRTMAGRIARERAGKAG